MWMIGIIPVLLVAFIIYSICWHVSAAKEGKKRKAMIMNPNDHTVREYIKVLLVARSWIMRNVQPGDPTQMVLKKEMKQIQAWEIIKESPDVSPEVKNKLRNAFLKCDVSIKP